MARWSDLQKLRMDMDMLQAKVKAMYSRGKSCEDIAHTLDISERATRVIIKWKCKE